MYVVSGQLRRRIREAADRLGYRPNRIAAAMTTGKTHTLGMVVPDIANPFFGELLASVGLAQNFAALRALATEGAQRGHMALHAQNIAMMAGARGDEIDAVAKRLVALGKVRVDVAETELAALRAGR